MFLVFILCKKELSHLLNHGETFSLDVLTSVVMRPDVIANLQRQREEKARLTSLEKMSFFVKENLLSLQCSRLSLYAHLYKTDTQSWSLLFFTPFI